MAQTVTPYLLYEDAEAAAAFLTRAFGLREIDRQTGAAGGLHLELETELGGRIYAGQPTEGFRNPAATARTSIVYVIVAAVDAHHDRAKAEGATITEELVDLRSVTAATAAATRRAKDGRSRRCSTARPRSETDPRPMSFHPLPGRPGARMVGSDDRNDDRRG
jgi:uncharacterized glyoxalase superfamily protein PhnB